MSRTAKPFNRTEAINDLIEPHPDCAAGDLEGIMSLEELKTKTDNEIQLIRARTKKTRKPRAPSGPRAPRQTLQTNGMTQIVVPIFLDEETRGVLLTAGVRTAEQAEEFISKFVTASRKDGPGAPGYIPDGERPESCVLINVNAAVRASLKGVEAHAQQQGWNTKMHAGYQQCMGVSTMDPERFPLSWVREVMTDGMEGKGLDESQIDQVFTYIKSQKDYNPEVGL